MAEGFLGRWSRRKQAVQEGRPLAEPEPPPQRREPVSAERSTDEAAASPEMAAATESTPKAPPPTLQDVGSLTPSSDYQPFVGREVAAEVRNAAMKKLFTDPHFNIVDGLDVYLDDYSIPSPLPAAVLRQMAGAKLLNLVDDEEADGKKKPVPALADNARHDEAVAVAGAGAPAAAAPQNDRASDLPAGTKQETDEHTDLRLQQDDAAGPQGAGGGTQ